MRLKSYAAGRWVEGTGRPAVLANAVTGEPVAEIDSTGLDFAGMLDHARRVGGPALRKLTFHQRALRLKELAAYLMERKEEFYELSKATGATRTDSWIDVEGGIGTLFAYASKGRRELPNATVYLDGPPEPLSRGGSFVGQHVCVPLEGAAVHINAFNFPGWGMLEKLAPTLLAGMPAIVKPASQTAYLAELMFRRMVESGIFPEGSLQLVCGGTGDLLDHLTGQDVVTFTGSAATGRRLRQHPAILGNAVRFTMEADSLNFSLLGPDADAGQPGIRPLRQGGRARDDGEGRAEVHGDPPGAGAAGAGRGGDRGPARAAGADGGGRSRERGGADGRARQPRAARGGAGAGARLAAVAEIVAGSLDKVEVVGADPEKGRVPQPDPAALRRAGPRAAGRTRSRPSGRSAR